jgi:hypothetical protein
MQTRHKKAVGVVIKKKLEFGLESETGGGRRRM